VSPSLRVCTKEVPTQVGYHAHRDGKALQEFVMVVKRKQHRRFSRGLLDIDSQSDPVPSRDHDGHFFDLGPINSLRRLIFSHQPVEIKPDLRKKIIPFVRYDMGWKDLGPFFPIQMYLRAREDN
jgi:hypothetical protein